MLVKIFFCYAHEDESLLNKIRTHLRPLQKKGLIEMWHDRDISAGTEWERVIDAHLNQADIILLLISPDFMASDYCYSIEMKRAMKRHEQGKARVIPILLRPVDWKAAPFAKLQMLPKDAKAIINWTDQDVALHNVAEGIRRSIDEVSKQCLHGSKTISTQRTIFLNQNSQQTHNVQKRQMPFPSKKRAPIMKILSHPTWQGISAIVAILTLIVGIVPFLTVFEHLSSQTPTGNNPGIAVSGSSTFTPTSGPTTTPSPTPICPPSIKTTSFQTLQSLVVPSICIGILTAYSGDIYGKHWSRDGALLALPSGKYNGYFYDGKMYFVSTNLANTQFCDVYNTLISEGHHVAYLWPLPNRDTYTC